MGTKPRFRPKRLAGKLLHIRRSLGLSQSELVRLLDMDHLDNCRISEYERNIREPSLITLLAYGYLVGIPIDDLVDDKVDLPAQITIKRKRKRIAVHDAYFA
jgi:transcriptional regulator with XRE-family HTH domain